MIGITGKSLGDCRKRLSEVKQSPMLSWDQATTEVELSFIPYPNGRECYD